MYTHTYIYIHIYIYMHASVYVHVYAYACAYVYVNVYVFTLMLYLCCCFVCVRAVYFHVCFVCVVLLLACPQYEIAAIKQAIQTNKTTCHLWCLRNDHGLSCRPAARDHEIPETRIGFLEAN